MVRPVVVAIAVLLAFLIDPSVAGSQPGWWGTGGEVIDAGAEGDVPLAGATVTVTDSNGASKTGVVGTDGKFGFSLPTNGEGSGILTITATAPTYQPFSGTFTVEAGAGIGLTIRLERAEGYETTPSTSLMAEPQLSDQIRRLYLASFGRDADDSGLAFWIENRTQGATLATAAEAFAQSPEFVASYGPLDNQAFVERLYVEVLDRPSDSDGAARWVTNLTAGMPRGDVLAHFSESPEFVALTETAAPVALDVAQIARLYLAALERYPDQPGLNEWHRVLRSGIPIVGIAQALVDSEEFLFRYRPADYLQGLGGPATLDNESYVTQVYLNVLDREPDAGGLAAWTDQLDAGMSRGRLVLHFADSAEFLAASDMLPPW